MFANRKVRGVTVPSVVLYIVVVIVIIAYGACLRKIGCRDPLAQPLFNHPICQEIDGWSVTHFLFFGLLGLFYPGQHLQFFVIGYLWEIVETALGQNKIEVSGTRLQLEGELYPEGRPTGNSDAYWYGKESDVIADMFGYCIGSSLATIYWPNDDRRLRRRYPNSDRTTVIA